MFQRPPEGSPMILTCLLQMRARHLCIPDHRHRHLHHQEMQPQGVVNPSIWCRGKQLLQLEPVERALDHAWNLGGCVLPRA